MKILDFYRLWMSKDLLSKALGGDRDFLPLWILVLLIEGLASRGSVWPGWHLGIAGPVGRVLRIHTAAQAKCFSNVQTFTQVRLEGTPIHSRSHREGWATDPGNSYETISYSGRCPPSRGCLGGAPAAGAFRTQFRNSWALSYALRQ